MRRAHHENVATVLVNPCVLAQLELHLMSLDLPVWPVSTAPVCVDGVRLAFQIRHRLLQRQRGAWDIAAEWIPVWVAFGPSWRNGDEPLPWSAHAALWHALDGYADEVRFDRRLGGVPRLPWPVDAAP
jgi:hypothetical protein